MENRNAPTADEVLPIRGAIKEAWKDIPQPDWSDFIMEDRETERAREYYYQRRVEDVDLDHPYAVGELPLDYFSPSAATYYLKAFLEYILEIDQWQGGVVTIHTISYLCSKRKHQRKLSLPQVDCIIAVLSIVAKYRDFYCFEMDRDAKYLANGLAKWTEIAASMRKAGAQVFTGKV